MIQNRLANVCRGILECIKKGRAIEEEQAFVFLDGIVDVLTNPEAEGFENELEALAVHVKESWQYGDVERMSGEQAFLCGGLWAGEQIIEKSRNRKQESRMIFDLARKYENNVWILKAIDRKPGIRHKELAAYGKVSPSRLSQFIANITSDGLLTYNRSGREKYYYLQKRGEQVYGEIKRRERRVAAHQSLTYKAINNHEYEDEILIGDIMQKHSSYAPLIPKEDYSKLIVTRNGNTAVAFGKGGIDNSWKKSVNVISLKKW